MKIKPERFKVVEVSKLPACDFCGEPARYDFRSRFGPWGYACAEHYRVFRANNQLGEGKGQMLVTPDEVLVEEEEMSIQNKGGIENVSSD